MFAFSELLQADLIDDAIYEGDPAGGVRHERISSWQHSWPLITGWA
jgi:hypothetical protein